MIKRKKELLCAIASVTFASSAIITPNAMEATSIVKTINTTTYTTTTSLNVRKGAGTKYSKIGTLAKGQSVEVISISNGWAKISYNKGTAYIGANYIKKSTTSSTAKEMIVKVDDLNIRTGANTKYKSIGKLNKGDKVKVLETLSNGWVKIDFNGKIGYVSNVKGAYLGTATNVVDTRKEMTVKVNDLNVRTGASTKYKSIGKLNKGDKIVALEELSNGWVKISFKGKIGYVSNVKGAYLEAGLLVADKEGANKVMSLINALNKDITLADKDAILKANEEFNKLSTDAKNLVTNFNILQNAIIKISELEKNVAEDSKNEATAKEFMAKIAKLDKTITLEDKSAVEETRKAYDKLSPNVKKYVRNLNILESAEAQLVAIDKKINNVSALIANLPQDLEISDKIKVQEARDAYDALTDGEKKSISNFHVSILKNAEARIKQLEQELDDKSLANDIINKINELNKTITINDEDEIKAVRKLYDNSKDSVKALVTNISILEDAENQLNTILNKIRNVLSLIDNLPSEIAIGDKTAVEEAREAYEDLTTEEKERILDTQLNILISAENKIAELELMASDTVIAQQLVERISALKEQVDFSDKDEIRGIREAYDKLIAPAKNLVNNYNKLEESETKLNSVLESIINVTTLIERLPETVTYDNKTQVEEAQDNYDKLGASNQAGINSELVEKLNRATAKIKELETLKENILQNNESVKEVVNDITSLPVVDDVQLSHKSDILGVINKFKALSEDVKFAVDTTKLEEVFDKLELLMSNDVISEINDLPEIDSLELTNKSTVEAIRVKFNEISTRNNALVTNIDKLVEAEAKIKELESLDKKIKAIIEKIDLLEDKNDVTFDNLQEEKAKVKEIKDLIKEIPKEKWVLITNMEKLEEVGNKVEILDRVSNISTVEQVKELINNLPSVSIIDWSHENAIVDARNAYNKLSEEDKLLVDNLQTLENAETEYARVRNAINEIITAIEKIPAIEELSIGDKQTVADARNLYDSSEEKVSAYFIRTNSLKKLLDAEAKIKTLEAEVAPPNSGVEQPDGDSNTGNPDGDNGIQKPEADGGIQESDRENDSDNKDEKDPSEKEEDKEDKEDTLEEQE